MNKKQKLALVGFIITIAVGALTAYTMIGSVAKLPNLILSLIHISEPTRPY